MVKRLRTFLKWTHRHFHHRIPYVAFKNERSLNEHIISLCRKNLFQDALRVFDALEENADFLLYPSTYTHLILACSSLKFLEYGRQVHAHILLHSNLQPDMILENHILNMYAKCGSTGDARKVFDNMRERNVVSWTALIAGYSRQGLEMEGIKLYIQMQQSGFVPDHFTFGSVIKACSNLTDASLGKQLHAQVLKSEFGSSLTAQNALISMYTKFDLINEALDVFSHTRSKDLVTWSSMISGFSKLGYEIEALYCFKEMLSHGRHLPNQFTFGSVFSACGCLGAAEYGRQVHGMSIKYGLKGDAFTGCSLTDMYANCGYLGPAKRAFDLIENPDLASWNALIAGFAYGGDANSAMSIFSQMRHLGFVPDDWTVCSLLCSFMDPLALFQGKQVHSYIIKTGLYLDIHLCNTLVTMYANCSSCMDAYKIFSENQLNADLVSWNAIISMCLHYQQVGEVFSLFRKMLSQERPDYITLINMLGACSKLASLEMGNQIFCFALKNGFEIDILVNNASIDMYVKCGSLNRARKLFDCMVKTDCVSWSSLILGYAQFGYAEEALNLFMKMKNLGINPNQVTLLGVLTACSHVGLVEEGMQLFNSMEKEHNVIPTKEHCSCVVDLLARAGRIHEAEAFVNQMEFEPNIVIWKTLLAACKTRNNIEVGKRVAENILKMDPSNSEAHVLLCNIYASAGCWKDVAALRSSMRVNNGKKIPGQSWIEVCDRINVFSAEDGVHPEREKIYTMLEEMWLQTLDADYVASLE